MHTSIGNFYGKITVGLRLKKPTVYKNQNRNYKHDSYNRNLPIV